jgi:ABC-2 type transport system permease protein
MTALLHSTRAELLRVGRWAALWVLPGTWATLDVLFVYVLDDLAHLTGDCTGPTAGASANELLVGLLPPAVPASPVQGMPVSGGAILTNPGALAAGSGHGWGTWKTTFTRGPGRAAAVGGTLLAPACWSAACGPPPACCSARRPAAPRAPSGSAWCGHWWWRTCSAGCRG